MATSRIARLRSLLARLLRWTLWLGLSAALLVQLRVLSDGGLRVPDFVLDIAARRLARHGVVLRAEAVWLDPRGRVLVIEPRLALAGNEEPSDFAAADAVSLRLLRRDLLRGKINPARVELAGLSLRLPARQSPSGVDEVLLAGGEFRLSRPPGEAWIVEQASARVLDVPTAFSGVLPSGGAAAPVGDVDKAVRITLRRAADFYRRLADLPLDSVRSLRIDLSPDRLVASAGLPRLDIPDHPAIPDPLVGSSLENVGLALALPFDDSGVPELRIEAGRLAAPAGLALETGPVSLGLRAPAKGEIELDLAASGIRKTDTTVPPAPLVLSARHSAADGRLAARFSTRLADAPWSVSVEGLPASRSGSASAAGALTPALLDQIRPFLPPKARPILTIADPVSVALTASAADGAPGPVVVRAVAGRAVAHHVRFDRAGAVLTYDHAAGRLRADELVLVQDDSLAAGSYEMDARTLDFRFLLGGRLRPMAIEGWFSGWWDRFWDDFGFGPRPADAEVDIQGRWGHVEPTTVFVGASSGPMKLRAQPLDALSTRVWIRYNFFDILAFRATHEGHVAEGSFAQSLAENGHWSRLAFDVRADFPLSALPNIFPDDGPAIAEPFSLDAPPRIHLVGSVAGPGAPADQTGRQRYALDLSTSAPLRYHGFPLDHLSLRLEREDALIKLENIRAGFADGLARGRAELSGPEADRWLAFDLQLHDAKPDLVIARWRAFQATFPPAPETTEPASRSESAPQPLGGSLDFSLRATGPLEQPLGYSGRGSARITGADLARIRLLGGLSSVLSEIGVGLTTLRLTDLEADFDLQKNRLVFDTLKLTGPSALVEADGEATLPEGGLAFSAKVRPFEQKSGIISSTVGLVLTPLTHVLEVELDGTLENPGWTFSYGPTRLFRRITGQRPKSSSTAPEPTPPAPPVAPVPSPAP